MSRCSTNRIASWFDATGRRTYLPFWSSDFCLYRCTTCGCAWCYSLDCRWRVLSGWTPKSCCDNAYPMDVELAAPHVADQLVERAYGFDQEPLQGRITADPRAQLAGVPFLCYTCGRPSHTEQAHVGHKCLPMDVDRLRACRAAAVTLSTVQAPPVEPPVHVVREGDTVVLEIKGQGQLTLKNVLATATQSKYGYPVQYRTGQMTPLSEAELVACGEFPSVTIYLKMTERGGFAPPPADKGWPVP